MWWHRSGSTLAQVMACCLTHRAIPMLTNHQWGLLALILQQFYRRCSWYLSLISVWILLNQDYRHMSQGQVSWCSFHVNSVHRITYVPWVSGTSVTLQWRHTGRDSVSNHQPHDCLLNRIFRRRSKKRLPKWIYYTQITLQWRNNERDFVLNHRRLDCLLSRLFRRRSKKASKLRSTGLHEGNSSVTVEFPAQRSSNAKNVSIWWRNHVCKKDPPHIFLWRLFHPFSYLFWFGHEVNMLNSPNKSCAKMSRTTRPSLLTPIRHYLTWKWGWLKDRNIKNNVDGGCYMCFNFRNKTLWAVCISVIVSPPPPKKKKKKKKRNKIK